MKNSLILVVGATGTVGSEVVKQLIEGGHRVRELVRNPAKASKFGNEVEVVKKDPAKLRVLVTGTSGFLGGNILRATLRGE